MRKCIFLLVVVFVVLASSDAVAVGKESKLSSTVVGHPVQTNINGKRMLRASDDTNGVEEERGISELGAKLKLWEQKFRTWVTNSKLVQRAQKKLQTLAEKRRARQVEQWVKKDVSGIILFQKQVTPDEYFLALKLNPNLKFYADSAVARANNPGLDKFFTYSTYYNYMHAVD